MDVVLHSDITLARSRMTDIRRVRVNKRRQTLQKQRHLWQIGRIYSIYRGQISL
jgi:hypothetical protein